MDMGKTSPPLLPSSCTGTEQRNGVSKAVSLLQYISCRHYEQVSSMLGEAKPSISYPFTLVLPSLK